MTQEKALQALHAENERLGLYKDAYGINTTKPVVMFIGEARFFDSTITDEQKTLYGCDSNDITQAVVRGIDHPILGTDKITTSIVIKKFDDGSFETLNTIYKPQKEVYNG
jgi:hypothetical protein